MATVVCFEHLHTFKVLSDEISWLDVTGFSDGIAEIVLDASANVEYAFDLAMGCFEKGSNFRQEVLKAYDLNPNAELKSIQVSLLDGEFFVSPTTTDAEREKIIRKYCLNKPMRPTVSSLCW